MAYAAKNSQSRRPTEISLASLTSGAPILPASCRIEFTQGSSIRPVRFDISHPAFSKVRDALTTEWGHQAAFICGDAAPAIHAFREALGMEIVVTSFMSRDSCHCPHEMPESANYRHGIRSWARVLGALSH